MIFNKCRSPMKNEQEKSDLSMVVMGPANKPGDWVRSRRSQGRGPRGTREGNIRAGLYAGKACPWGIEREGVDQWLGNLCLSGCFSNPQVLV
jgi:hypothetical protein